VDSVEAKTNPDDALLKDLKRRFLRAYKAKKKWIAEKTEDAKFYDGEQWTNEEQEELKARGQPVVTVNRIKPKIDAMCGIQLALRTMTRAIPRGNMDFDQAKFVTEALRFVEYHSNFQQKEARVFEDMGIEGLSWYEVTTHWDGMDAKTFIEYASNEEVFEDPLSKKMDLSDAKDISKSYMVDLEDAVHLFPGHEEEIRKCIDYDEEPASLSDVHRRVRPDQYDSAEGESEDPDVGTFIDKKRRQIRLTTTWYRIPYVKRILAIPSQGAQDVSGMSKKEIEKLIGVFDGALVFSDIKYRMNMGTFIWNTLLEHKENVRDYDVECKYPFVRSWCFISRDGKRMPYGFVRQMKDPQREINKRRSKMLHILSTNQIEMQRGAVELSLSELKQEAARPDGVIVKNPGFEFQRVTRTDLAQGQFQLLQEAKVEIENVGIKNEIEGQSRATSGRDFQLRQQQAQMGLRKAFSNLREARRQVMLIVLDEIQQFWRQEEFIKITDDPDAEGVELNKRVENPDGTVTIVNDLSIGKYDLIIDEAPDTISLQSEQFEQLASLAGKGLPIPVDMLIESSSLPNKKQVLQRIQEQQQQQMQMMQMQAAQGVPAQ
jgi:hypothetical protein